MNKACPCLAGAAALALAFTVSLISPPPAVEAAPAGPNPLQRDPNSPYAHTAIGAIIDANGGKLPATGEELAKALAKLGDFVQLPVPFSAVALNSGLTHPRVIITLRPSSHPKPVRDITGSFGGGWGGGNFGTSKLIARTPIPLGETPKNEPYLEGRLFLAANTVKGPHGNPVVKTVEFLSWNSHRQKFDFGVIEGMGAQPELKILDGKRCFSCHKNKGPILGVAPWSNTAHNDLVRNTSKPRFTFAPRLNAEGQVDPTLGLRDDIDGLTLLTPSGPEVDAAVRQGAEVIRAHDTFKLLARTANGRKAFILLLTAITTPGSLDKLDEKLKFELNKLDLVAFMREAHAANKAAAPSTLADFSPAGPVKREVFTNGPGGRINQVVQYDSLRAAGDPSLPAEHQPSNPKAFVRPAVVVPKQPSQLLNAVMLVRAIGLSEDDRRFLMDALIAAAKKLNSPLHPPEMIAQSVFTGARFADVLETGTLPERDDFKDRFIAGITDIMRWNLKPADFWLPRDQYASSPRFDPKVETEKEVVVLPSHACLACHDVRGAGKPAFNPIPQLAFDPFDVVAREAWLKTADRKQRTDVLSRLVKRLATDKTMPPEDSTEYELFRVKDPAALDAVKEWLEAELKKAKGK